jgi:hypothetical protein
MSQRGYSKRSVNGKQRERTRFQKDVQLPLCPEELVELMQDSLSSFATEMGLRISTKGWRRRFPS